MKFGYTIIYVPDVAATLDFYGRAFRLSTRFVDDAGQYGEMDTGTTVLAFASRELGAHNLPGGYQPVEPDGLPFGIELAFVTEDVPAAVARAVASGAVLVAEPVTKPWGQVVAYVRAPEGTLVEICSPVGE
jgi:lactoylglutathione lyase